MKKILFLNLILLLSAFSLHAQSEGPEFETEFPIVDTIYSTYIDEMPEPLFDMQEYLMQNLRYPDDAKNNFIEGRINVKFVINTNGYAVDPVIVGNRIKGAASLEEEAIRLVKNMSKWKAGKHKGRPAKVYYVLPLTWRIDK